MPGARPPLCSTSLQTFFIGCHKLEQPQDYSIFCRGLFGPQSGPETHGRHSGLRLPLPQPVPSGDTNKEPQPESPGFRYPFCHCFVMWP